MACLRIMQGLAENQLCHMTSSLRTRPSTNIIASDNIQFLHSSFSALKVCDFFWWLLVMLKLIMLMQTAMVVIWWGWSKLRKADIFKPHVINSRFHASCASASSALYMFFLHGLPTENETMYYLVHVWNKGILYHNI